MSVNLSLAGLTRCLIRVMGFVWIAPACLWASTTNYTVHLWNTDSGLPGSRVTDVIQSRDGYLWLGTRSGLARFDGVRFTVFDSSNTPEIRSPHVTCLFEDAEGTIWMGHDTGDLTCFRNGKFQSVPVKAVWHRGKILGIGADVGGDVWILNSDGELARVKDGLVIPLPAGRVVHLVAFSRRPHGGLWIQRDDEVSLLENGSLKPIQFDPVTTSLPIRGICASRDGGLWVVTASRALKWKDGNWVEDLGPTPWGMPSVHVLIETKDGRLAAATSDSGLYLIFPGQGSMQLCRTNGFPEDWITSLCEDREGNLWAGTGNSGLAVLRAGNITTLAPPDHWQGRAILSIAKGPNGALWIGTEGAGLYEYRNGIWINFDQSVGLQHRYIWSVLPDSRGKMWVGTWGGGLLGWNGAEFGLPQDLSELTAPVPALFALPDGALLVGTGVGLMRYEAGKTTWLAREPEVSLPDVRAVVATPEGTIWFGMCGGGVCRLKHGSLRQFRRGDGLSSDIVQCLHLENEETLWIGTLNGLNRFRNGRFAAITTEQGLANDTICDIEDDGLGYFWISSHGGIMRISKAELNHCAEDPSSRVHCLTYGLSDGMPTLECSGGFQPAACWTEDGRLWFPTSQGVVAVDPRHVAKNTLIPPVVVERLLVDDRVVWEGVPPEHRLQIAPGRHRFEFQFAGLSFVAPEMVRFRYRLDGAETDWVETQSPRKAFYGHLAPGDYRFRVLACNNDGVWNTEGAALGFSVLPEFWQRGWFRVSGGVLTAFAGGGIVWLNSRRTTRLKLERIERQQAVERERMRIAKDLHDDLGASLTRIAMLSESACNGPGPSTRDPSDLEQIHDTARELIRAMGEVVWAVNPRHDTLEGLAAYLEEFGQHFLRTAGFRCKLSMPLRLPGWTLTAELRHNVFLAFKEALHNSVKHAGESEVRISLTLQTAAFTLSVEDNGAGFELKPPAGGTPPEPARRSNGNGLTNMRQRIAEIGGQCEITSAPGIGTRVLFIVPVKEVAS